MLVGTTQTIHITPGTRASQAYGKEEVAEEFHCNYGLNPAYRDTIGNGVLKVVGVDPEGEVRIVELCEHRFFIATLFLPQLVSGPDTPQPLVVSYLKAAIAFQASQRRSEIKVWHLPNGARADGQQQTLFVLLGGLLVWAAAQFRR